MIKLIDEGDYRLIETKGQTKILTLMSQREEEKKSFAWINAVDIGELLVSSHNTHKTDAILSLGKYRIYDVKDDPIFTDLEHLELFVGQGTWQGYLLLNGLPTLTNLRRRIVPTEEVITKAA